MQTININLLPTAKKERLEKLVKFSFIKHILILAILGFSLIGMALLWSLKIMQDSSYELATVQSFVSKEHFTYNQQIKQINKAVSDINNAGQNYSIITPRLTEIINHLPSNIKLDGLSLDKGTNQLILSGTAKTRADLLNYQDLLANVKWLTNVQTPLSKLFQKENINFEFKMQIRKSE